MYGDDTFLTLDEVQFHFIAISIQDQSIPGFPARRKRETKL